MVRRSPLRFALAAFLTLAVALHSAPARADAESILAQVNSHLNFPDSTLTMQMVVVKGDKEQKSYLMKVRKKDSERLLIDFLQPDREKGRKLLRVGDKMWMYLPDLGKSIVISARQSFLGSSLSNGDLLRSDLVADYTPSLLREETLGGEAAQVLELRAKSPQVAYDRIVLWVAKSSSLPLREEFYTRSGKLIKVLHFSTPVTLGGVLVQSEMRIESELNKTESTLLTLRELALDQKLAPALFLKDGLDRL